MTAEKVAAGVDVAPLELTTTDVSQITRTPIIPWSAKASDVEVTSKRSRRPMMSTIAMILITLSPAATDGMLAENEAIRAALADGVKEADVNPVI